MAISPQRFTIYLYSAHRAVIFAIAHLNRIFVSYCVTIHYSVTVRPIAWFASAYV